MIRVALKGLAGRRLRTALTALAIVLGVAMVSGTYALTDRMDRAVDALFTGAYTGADAVISGKTVVETSANGDATVPAALLDRVAALPQVEAASGGIVDTARLVDRSGKPLSTRDAAIGVSVDRTSERAPVRPAAADRWPLAGGVDGDGGRRRHRPEARPGRRRPDRRRHARPGPAVHDYRRREVHRPELDRQADARDLRRPDRAGALSEDRPARRDLGGGEGRRFARKARAHAPAARARRRRSCHRRGQSEGRGQGQRQAGRDHPEAAARVRRHRALRRRPRHLQHVLDHDRAAHARARDPAHARGVAPPGPGLGHPRVDRHRHPGLRHRPVPRPRARPGPGRIGGRRGQRAPGQRRGARHAHRRGLPARRRPDHAHRWARPGPARDARAADRRRARGGDTAEVAARTVHAADRGGRDRARRGRHLGRPVRRRPWRAGDPRPARARLPAAVPGRGDDLVERSSNRLPRSSAGPLSGWPARPAGWRARTRCAIPAGQRSPPPR